jgi:uncharacterized protein
MHAVGIAQTLSQNPPMPIDTPLTEAEFDRLDDFLISDGAPDNTMDTSMLDGYLAAVASGPNLVMPDQMLRWIWDTENGEESPEFKDQAEASEVVSLILRHYQHVNSALNNQQYEPMILERRHKRQMISIIDEWCVGYCIGIAADDRAWQPLLDSKPELFKIIKLYGTEDGWDILEKKPLAVRQHEAAADSLADSARLIHAFWLDQRRRELNRGETPGIMPSRVPVHAPVKVGRNEPCPCGSGKKYKHCHGGPAAGAPANDKQWLH